MASDPHELSQEASTQRGENSEFDIADLASKAERCRRLAAGISDRQAADVLRSMAANYEQSAARLSKGE